ncbi:hypothetical protein ACFWY9_35610 [Amycolatopsis sp. NPDC059027]|uniref:hypothetical protein n=1 Tax=Amycolatopsis sp. NPDC059027 TaxID=3346709 RepID=UPI00366FF169
MLRVDRAFAAGILGLSLLCASCSGDSGTATTPSGSASSPASSTPANPGSKPDCATLVTQQEAQSAVGKPLTRDETTTKPPTACGYSTSDGGLVGIRYLTVFPVGQGVATKFEGRTALLGDSSQKQPPQCALYVQLGSGPDTLAVTVRAITNPDLCSAAKSLAHTALSRLPAA